MPEHDIEFPPSAFWSRTSLGSAVRSNIETLDTVTKGISDDGNVYTIPEKIIWPDGTETTTSPDGSGSHTHDHSELEGVTEDAHHTPYTDQDAIDATDGTIDADTVDGLHASDIEGGSGGGLDVYDVTTYGAAGDGSTDDTTAIQDAIDAAENAGGGRVYFPAGMYVITSQITIEAHNITLVGDGAKLSMFDATAIGPSTYPIVAQGTQTGSAGFQAAERGDTSVTLSDSGDSGSFEQGQLVKIQSDDEFNSTGTNEGEMNVVQSVDSDTIHFERPLEADYSTSPQLLIIDWIENFNWKDLGLQMATDQDDYYGFKVEYARDVKMEGGYIGDAHQRGITPNNCFNVIIEDFTIERCLRDGYGYGINPSQATTFIRIRDCVFRDTRHGIAHSGAAYGVQRHSVVEGCTVEQNNPHNMGLDAHDEAEYITFRDNTCNGCGINLRGDNMKAVDNDIMYASNYAISMSGADIQRNVTLKGNRIIEPETQGVVITSTGHINLKIKDNYYRGKTDNSVNAFLFNGPLEDSEISGNTIKYGAFAIYLRDVSSISGVSRENVRVVNNSVTESTEGIYCSGSDIYSECLIALNDCTDNDRNMYEFGFDDTCEFGTNIGFTV